MNFKRIFDIFVALCGLLIFAPLWLMITVLILIEDGPPVFFIQERVGRHLRPFKILKLRSMRNNRITRIGRWIRKTGLDETPQFINVLTGTMSLVGPRPMTRENLERLNLYLAHLPRFRLLPGITGMAQLYAGRGVKVTNLLERRYFESQSIFLDLLIVLLSFMVNIFGKRRIGNWLHGLRNWQRHMRPARSTSFSCLVSWRPHESDMPD